MAEIPEDKLYEMLFMQLVMSLSEAAMAQLGKIVNPTTGKVDRAVPQARGTIDLLRMLKDKTRNNLNDRERQLLDQSVMTLQMNYVYEAEQDAKSDANPAETGTDSAAAGPKH